MLYTAPRYSDSRHVITPYKLHYLLFNNVPFLAAGISAVPRTADFLMYIFLPSTQFDLQTLCLSTDRPCPTFKTTLHLLNLVLSHHTAVNI